MGCLLAILCAPLFVGLGAMIGSIFGEAGNVVGAVIAIIAYPFVVSGIMGGPGTDTMYGGR